MNALLGNTFLFFLITLNSNVSAKENFVLNDERRISYEKWNNLVKIMQVMVNGHATAKLENSDEPRFSFTCHDLTELTKEEDGYRLNSFENDTSQCSMDIKYIFDSLKEQWALEMIDSYGKVSSGLLEGNFAWPGSYDECINVYAPLDQKSTRGNFKGKYCTINWSVLLSADMKPITLTTGACIPGSCSDADLKDDYASQLLKIAGAIPLGNKIPSLNISSITCKSPLTEFSNSAIAMICLMSFFGALVLFGSSITGYEYFQKTSKTNFSFSGQNIPKDDIITLESNGESVNDVQNASDDNVLVLSPPKENVCTNIFKKIKPFLKCFCAFTNGSKILNTDSGEGQLLCIHGIRFLSLSWVILGHTYLFGISAGIKNPKLAFKAIDSFPFQIVFQAFYAVDSFFVLSGFLLTYLYFNEMTKRNGKMSWIYFYVHRYIRLTPVYMIVLGFIATLSMYLGSGPFWPAGDIDENCAKYWWRNLLYINNLFGADTLCVNWSWYLSNDMQFYVISPLFLYTLWRWPKIGFSIIGTFLCASFASNWGLTYKYDLIPGMSQFNTNNEFYSYMYRFQVYFDKLYIKSYARIGPYLIGVLLGYIYFKCKDKRTLTSFQLLIGWIIASLLTLTVIYGLYHTEPNVWVTRFYNTFSRTCFGIGLSWVIYVCLTSGGIVDRILSFKIFIPLSRLTYCAYLVHPIIMMTYYQSFREPLVLTQATMITVFFGMLVISYGVAFITTLIFESPIMGLEKEITKKFKSKNLSH